MKRLDQLKITKNLKNTFYLDKEIRDTMKEFYLIKKILKEQFHFHLFELEHLIELEHLPEHLIELEHLPEHLIWELIDARTMTLNFVDNLFIMQLEK